MCKRTILFDAEIFLVVLDEDRLVGTGAVRQIDDTICELKRMWLLTEYHGQGIGYRVMRCFPISRAPRDTKRFGLKPAINKHARSSFTSALVFITSRHLTTPTTMCRWRCHYEIRIYSSVWQCAHRRESCTRSRASGLGWFLYAQTNPFQQTVSRPLPIHRRTRTTHARRLRARAQGLHRGRLDYDSEGLVILTDSGALQQQISNHNSKCRKLTGRKSKALRQMMRSNNFARREIEGWNNPAACA